jgi:DNA-binding IclR family transcriptional regulator
LARRALSGSRVLDILELIGAEPERLFTLSELVRATNSNFASCSAVLALLVERNYLVRDTTTKAYRLGPALYVIGQAMYAQDRLLPELLCAAENLTRRLGLVISITARAGNDLVGVGRFGAQSSQGLRIGQRAPLKPPLGATLIAWSDESETNHWLERGGIKPDSAEAMEYREELKAIRNRGYLATLDSDSYASLSAAVAYRNRADTGAGDDLLVSELSGRLFQVEQIDQAVRYDLKHIGAPLFDRAGLPVYSVVLGGFAPQITGADILSFASQFTRMCSDIMRASRR